MTTIHPFPYDPFQRRAIELIDRGVSLFVSAPTGAGKTVLADYVIERTLAAGARVIYTAPIKALSNQKFRDFTARHGEGVGIIPSPGAWPKAGGLPPQGPSEASRAAPGSLSQGVGIMTGDVTINPTAPLIIMTTEIYRNTLLEDPARLSPYAWVIFDEIHYLDDPERGTVWEEALLFTPPHIRLLCLSATIPNIEEIARWLGSIHGRPVEVVEETARPVPLTVLFQCHNLIASEPQELRRIGYRDGHAPPHAVRDERRHRPPAAAPANRIERLIRELLEHDRLPCIFFTFGRRRAEELAWEIAGLPLLAPGEREPLRALFDDLCARFQLTQDGSIAALQPLIDRGVGFHHAGMLPTAKEVLERCFTSRLMKLIVTTETFALGVNMPARSVVLDTLKKRRGAGFELLRRREFLQMSGRAGRRGMDLEGFVYLRVNPAHVGFSEVLQLLQGPPEPVHSRFNTAYATLLGLYRHHGRSLLEIFPRTLYYLQTSGARRQSGLDLMRRKLELLEVMGYLTRASLTPKGEFASWVYGYELLLAELYAGRRLSGLDPTSLALLMAALVYEPRPRTPAPRSHRLSKRLAELCRAPLAHIHREERRFQIAPITKPPAFHLSHALDAWMAKASFQRITRLADADEGELVRYFRMTVQLLRQLSQIPTGDPALHATAASAMRRINRDVIDAEAQLRLG